jgi:hypothetical protein
MLYAMLELALPIARRALELADKDDGLTTSCLMRLVFALEDRLLPFDSLMAPTTRRWSILVF